MYQHSLLITLAPEPRLALLRTWASASSCGATDHHIMSHPVRTVVDMASDFAEGPYVTDCVNLPRPGAVQLYHLEWVPTLDGEPIDEGYRWHRFRSRERALAEAIKWVKHRAGLAIEVTIGSRAGCCLSGDIPVIVETVAEARKAIVSYARGELSGYTRDAQQREHLRFKTRRGRSTWKSLLECETSRRYDPADAAAGDDLHLPALRGGRSRSRRRRRLDVQRGGLGHRTPRSLGPPRRPTLRSGHRRQSRQRFEA